MCEGRSLIMKGIGAFFLTICYLVLLAGCTISTENNPPLKSTVQNELKTNIPQNTDKNITTKNCMLDDAGNLLILSEDEYVPYAYEKLSSIPDKLAQIVQKLREDCNIIKLDYDHELSVYYICPCIIFSKKAKAGF